MVVNGIGSRFYIAEGKDEDIKLRQTCQDFESVFIAYLLKSMRKTVPKTEFINGGLSQDIYISMMDEEVARAVARGPGIGLAEILYRQLKSKNF